MKTQPSNAVLPTKVEDPLRMDRPCVVREIGNSLFKINTGLTVAFVLARLAQFRGQNVEILDEQTGESILRIVGNSLVSQDVYLEEQFNIISASIFQVARTILGEFNTIDRANYEQAQLALVKAVEENYAKEIRRLQDLTKELQNQLALLTATPSPQASTPDELPQTESAPQAD